MPCCVACTHLFGYSPGKEEPDLFGMCIALTRHYYYTSGNSFVHLVVLIYVQFGPGQRQVQKFTCLCILLALQLSEIYSLPQFLNIRPYGS